MDIAKLSMAQSLSSVQNQASLMMLKQSMEMAETTGANITKLMETVTPKSNHKIDVRA